jgi:nitric oxide dioxygenase
MLSEQSRPLIQVSVPVLREHGQRIARTFYAQMFAAHPELKNVFNLGNQASGAQQASLASALVAYAANIDNAAALLPVVRRIAHKHAAVGVKPAHYPIVARHLLAAVSEVLGAAATPELLGAWDEAYWLLAGELIAEEARLYERAQVQAGALQSLVVTRVERESSEVSSYYLERPEGGSPGHFLPGQYVSVALDLPDLGVSQLRQYSLSDSPTRSYWRISVKREPAQAEVAAGLVSNRLHETVVPGQRLRVSHAFGDFTPLASAPTAAPIALLSAGIGITPLLSALNALAQTASTRKVLFLHATRSAEHQLFQSELAAARKQLPALRCQVFCEHPATSSQLNSPDCVAGRMRVDSGLIREFAGAAFYLCGPDGFMREQWRELVRLGVSPLCIEREVFGPALLEALD